MSDTDNPALNEDRVLDLLWSAQYDIQGGVMPSEQAVSNAATLIEHLRAERDAERVRAEAAERRLKAAWADFLDAAMESMDSPDDPTP